MLSASYRKMFFSHNNKLFILALPIWCGVLVVFQRHLLLKVPKIGFILHALVGGPVPPFEFLVAGKNKYMGTALLQRHQEWLRPNDVVVTVPAKSGTTWSMYTLHLLRARGRPEPFRDIYEEVPWPEFIHYPGESDEERIEYIRNISRRYPFNIHKTHASPPEFPYREDVKYVVMIRNIQDVISSMRSFFASHGKEFAEMWGGFPFGAGEDELMPDEEWEKMILKDGGNGIPLIEPFVIDLVKNWWPYRNKPNVIFLHYSDRVKDDFTQLERLAKFLNIDLSKQELENLVSMLSFKEMRKVNRKFAFPHFFDRFKEKGLMADKVAIVREEFSHGMLSKGPERKGVEDLTPSMRQGVTNKLNQMFPPEIVEWITHGGDFPAHVESL